MGIAKDSGNLGGMINNFYVYENFPVDIRHNIKIDRKKLGEFARTGRARCVMTTVRKVLVTGGGGFLQLHCR